MTDPTHFDILIIGSGPSGVHAASRAIGSGLKVALLDIGYTDEEYEKKIPSKHFADIRKSDGNQQTYFLGKDPSLIFEKKRKAGTHLTPSRYHMIHDMDTLFPVSSKNFFGLQSTALGGLGVSWGANCFAFEECELSRIGLGKPDWNKYYSEVAGEIGVSGEKDSDITPFTGRFENTLPPLRIDDNADLILRRYYHKHERFVRNGFFLGKSPLAVLSSPHDGRDANPYYDMDFWADLGRSVYRPKYTLEKLKREPNFCYLPRRLALSFMDRGKLEVGLRCRNLALQGDEEFRAKRLILAAGAINSARLVLCSTGQHLYKLPILCTPNYWLAAINWYQLGKATKVERHSLSQLTSVMRTLSNESVIAQFYSYRSLLLFRLIHDMDLPPHLALLLLRLISTSLTCINLHFPDSPSPSRWIRIKEEGGRSVLEIDTPYSDEEVGHREREVRRFLRRLFELRCLPIKILRPTHGASIHYAGTLPILKEDKPLTCDEMCRLRGFNGVYVADSSTWNYLPAKGPTLTIMAQARRVADYVTADLKNG